MIVTNRKPLIDKVRAKGLDCPDDSETLPFRGTIIELLVAH